MGVGYSTIRKWVKQLKDERKGKQPKATPMTPEQFKIRELEKKIERIELEKDILKKATVNSSGQCNMAFNHSSRCQVRQYSSRAFI